MPGGESDSWLEGISVVDKVWGIQGVHYITLGAEGVLPGGYIESLLRVFKQFTHT